jgi:hypothetical protein
MANPKAKMKAPQQITGRLEVLALFVLLLLGTFTWVTYYFLLIWNGIFGNDITNSWFTIIIVAAFVVQLIIVLRIDKYRAPLIVSGAMQGMARLLFLLNLVSLVFSAPIFYFLLKTLLTPIS